MFSTLRVKPVSTEIIAPLVSPTVFLKPSMENLKPKNLMFRAATANSIKVNALNLFQSLIPNVPIYKKIGFSYAAVNKCRAML